MELLCGDAVCFFFFFFLFGGGRKKILNLRTNKLLLSNNDTSIDEGTLQSDQREMPVLSWCCFCLPCALGKITPWILPKCNA